MAITGIKTTYEFEREHPGDIKLLIPGWMGDTWGAHLLINFDGTTLTVAGR